MIEIILSHWATYLLLGWIALIVVANLWPRKRPANRPITAQFSPRRAEKVSAAVSFKDGLELARRD